MLLRLLVALQLELVLIADFYGEHPKFTYFSSGHHHPNTAFSLCLTKCNDNVFEDSVHNRKVAILSEAVVANKPKEWSGYFHLAVLSTNPNCQTLI